MSEDGLWTLESIGKQLTLHIAGEQELANKVQSLYQAVIVGNGKPSLVSENRRHSDWINNVNKFIWLVIGALVAQFVVSGCSFLVMVLIMLVNSGALTP